MAKWAWVLVFMTSVVGANLAISVWGVVPIGFGLFAPAGVLFAGFALTARDGVQETGGRKFVPIAIVVAAGVSALMSPAVALASGTAFLLSELADWGVYTPLRKRGLAIALLASNVVGTVIDSALFLGLAFGSLDFLLGQVVGKGYATVGALAVLLAMRWLRA